MLGIDVQMEILRVQSDSWKYSDYTSYTNTNTHTIINGMIDMIKQPTNHPICEYVACRYNRIKLEISKTPYINKRETLPRQGNSFIVHTIPVYVCVWGQLNYSNHAWSTHSNVVIYKMHVNWISSCLRSVHTFNTKHRKHTRRYATTFIQNSREKYTHTDIHLLLLIW